MRRTPSRTNLGVRSTSGRPPLPRGAPVFPPTHAHAFAAPRAAAFAATPDDVHPLASTALAPLMFELEDDASAPPPTARPCPHLTADTARVASLARPTTPYERALAADAAAAAPSAPTAAALAAALTERGHAASVRRARGGGAGTACFANLAHEHVVVRTSPDAAPIVVDASLRDALAVVAPPPALAALLAALPAVWVAPVARLEPVVRLVADRTRAALADAGRPTPPWRTAAALLSKWRVGCRTAAAANDAECTTGCCAAFEGARSPRGPLAQAAPDAALKPVAVAAAVPAAAALVAGASPRVSQLSAALAASGAAAVQAVAGEPAVRTVRWAGA